MNNKKTMAAVIVGVIIAGASIAYAGLLNPRHDEITNFYSEHTHSIAGDTIDAPQHSGGTDSWGCHNASVPYHCH
jgi:hypothetical protein